MDDQIITVCGTVTQPVLIPIGSVPTGSPDAEKITFKKLREEAHEDNKAKYYKEKFPKECADPDFLDKLSRQYIEGNYTHSMSVPTNVFDQRFFRPVLRIIRVSVYTSVLFQGVFELELVLCISRGSVSV